jgi:hypothetical protein
MSETAGPNKKNIVRLDRYSLTFCGGEETLAELLKDAPKNWGRWGPDDELGCLNFLDAKEVLRGAAEIRNGKVFTLGTPITSPGGDPSFPGVGRDDPRRTNSQDYSLVRLARTWRLSSWRSSCRPGQCRGDCAEGHAP